MKKKGILERLKDGPVLGDGGYLLELEKRGWVRAGPFTPEVVEPGDRRDVVPLRRVAVPTHRHHHHHELQERRPQGFRGRRSTGRHRVRSAGRHRSRRLAHARVTHALRSRAVRADARARPADGRHQLGQGDQAQRKTRFRASAPTRSSSDRFLTTAPCLERESVRL